MLGKGKRKEVTDAYVSNASNPTSYINMLQFGAPETQMGSSSNYAFMQVLIFFLIIFYGLFI